MEAKEVIKMAEKNTLEFLNSSIIFDLGGSNTLESLSNAKIGWPNLELASTKNLPKYPVAPITKILLLFAI